jgi:hypothetical protein
MCFPGTKKQTQNKPNSNPIQSQFRPKQSQFKPKQTQFQQTFMSGNLSAVASAKADPESSIKSANSRQ